MQIPLTNGYEICAQFKHNVQTNNIPVIFITGFSDDEHLAKAYEVGGVDYITKPFNKKTIHLKISTYLQIFEHSKSQAALIDELLSIGTSLTSENKFEVLMEKIMMGAKKFSNADAGTIYLLSEDKKFLQFEVVHTDSLNIAMGGTGETLNWPNLPLFIDEEPNYSMVAAKCAIDKKLLNIADVYDDEEFNFEGTKIFDSSTGYKSTSMLVVPMLDREGKLVGVLQLLNKLASDGHITHFNKNDEIIISSMASLGAVSIHNHKLIQSFDALLHSFINTIADTLEEKSHYTEHHIVRVAQFTMGIMDAINKDKTIYKDKFYSEEELDEINLAAMLHDIGKIIQPEHIVDKATRLETIYDRIESIITRFDLLIEQAKVSYLEQSLENPTLQEEFKKVYEEKKQQYLSDKDFIIKCNSIAFLNDEALQRIQKIASYKIGINNKQRDFLDPNELYNLSIRKGTLTDYERSLINHHVIVSYNMLKNLPFPEKYKKIPKLAGSHHKSVDGKSGYAAPEIMGLPLEFEEKILAIADVFEALTSPERPYKKPYSVNESFKIIASMVQEGHLDKELVKFIIDKKVYLSCGKDFIPKEQLDEITVTI